MSCSRARYSPSDCLPVMAASSTLMPAWVSVPWIACATAMICGSLRWLIFTDTPSASPASASNAFALAMSSEYGFSFSSPR